LTARFAYIGRMRRIVRRTATIVTVQTWTVSWAEEDPAAEPPKAEANPALPSGSEPEVAATRPEASDSPASAGSAD
jgi:hypothetical protein